jgi:ligand-binding sensor domain-containing protein/two-component sensor histidine kinase
MLRSKYRFYLFVLIFLTCFFKISYSQNSGYKWINYTTDNGLESNGVFQTFIDSKGFLWIATGNGINKFDGQKFTTLNQNNGLPDNTVFKVFEDQQNRIWYLPFSCKLSYFDGTKIILYKYNNIISKFYQNSINADLRFGNGYIDFMEEGDGILRIFDDGTFQQYNKTKPNAFFYEYVLVENQHRLITSSERHISLSPQIKLKLIDSTGNLIFQSPAIPMNATKLDRFVKINSADAILYTNNKTLYRIQNDGASVIQEFEHPILSLFVDPQNGIWVGTRNGGVYYRKNTTDKWEQLLNGNDVSSICMDKEKGYWLGTLKNGLYYLPDMDSHSITEGTGLPIDWITSLVSDDQFLYAAAKEKDIYKLNKDEKVISAIRYNNTFNDNTISCMYYDAPTKKIVVGAAKGGVIQNNKYDTIGLLDAANCIEPFNNWIITGHWSYMRCMINNRLAIPCIRKEKPIRFDALCKHNDSIIYIGTLDGLYSYNIASKIFDRIKIKGFEDNLRITDIKNLGNDEYIIATKGLGILLLRKNGTVKQIAEKDGLLSNSIKKIIFRKNTLWASSNKGLNKIDFSNFLSEIKISSFTAKNLLPVNEINDFIFFNDKLYIATSKGITVLTKIETQNNLTLPFFYTGINVSGKDTIVCPDYLFDYKQNNIEIKFKAISYKHAKEIQYRYKLTGMDTSWTYSIEDAVHYFSLPPGEYTFVCQGFIKNNTYSEEKKIHFIIASPFWKKWWFIILCVIAVFAFIYKLAEWIILKNQKIKNKKQELNQLVNELELKALRAQINPHFIFNVIYSIQHYIIFNQKEDAQKYLGKFAKLLRNVLTHSDVSQVSLKEDLDSLILYIDLEKMRFDDRFTYTINIQEGLETETILIPPMLIQPLVENAIKHGFSSKNKKGLLSIHVNATDEVVIFTIEDNGIGRKKALEIKQKEAIEHKSMGMTITKDRLNAIAELLQQRTKLEFVDLEDSNNNALGTKVIIEIPLVSQQNKTANF